MTTPNLSRYLGQAERAMRALLERHLKEADLSFPEWTTLVFVDGASPLTRRDLIARQLTGHVVADAQAARDAVDHLLSRGWLAPADERHSSGGGTVPDDVPLALTSMGAGLFGPLRETVGRITSELYGDLPAQDLEATQRTLAEIARRAAARLGHERSS